MTAELPDNAEAEQVQAWVELAELSQDPRFRAGVRRAAEDLAAEQATRPDGVPVRRDLAATVRDLVAPALAAEVAPESPRADPIVEALTTHYTRAFGRLDGSAPHPRLLEWLENAHDPRREKYLRLLAVVNGWPAPQSPAPEFDWATRALRARLP